jgi:catechol 2,3-dioxygenase-like lactoylglutathione lyase family enzyme
MILAFAHPGLVVRDIERARAFYEEAFGFTVLRQDNPVVDQAIGSSGSAARTYMMAGHNCYLELFEYSAPDAGAPEPAALGPHEPGIRHIAFYVDDCRAEFERCLGLGATALGTPPERDTGVNAVYLRDPCGNIIELCEIPAPEENPTKLPGISALNTGD